MLFDAIQFSSIGAECSLWISGGGVVCRDVGVRGLARFWRGGDKDLVCLVGGILFGNLSSHYG